MNILFLIPPITYTPSKGILPKPLRTNATHPNLGIRYIAAYLEAHTNHQTQLIDAPSYGMSFEILEYILVSMHIDVVAITVLTHTLFDVTKTVTMLKKTHPKCRIVLGGRHLSHYPNETACLSGVDFVLSGEADLSFTQLITALSLNATYSQLQTIPGLSWHHSTNIHVNNLSPIIPDLSNLPPPVGLRIENSAFAGFYPTQTTKAFIQTSRGCPFRCSFCSISGSHIRYRSISSVIREIKLWIANGVSDFFIIDDTFTASRNRVIEICNEIIRHNLKIQFRANARVDLIDEELLIALRRSGCCRLYYGVESGVQRLLDKLHKGITLSMINNVFKTTQNEGIETCAYVMIGLPDETYNEIIQTISFTQSLNADQIQLNVFEAYPGTKIYESLLSEGVIRHDYWQSFSRNPSNQFQLKEFRTGIALNEIESLISQQSQVFNQTTSDVSDSISIHISDDCKEVIWKTEDGIVISSEYDPITLHPDSLFNNSNRLPVNYLWHKLLIEFDDPRVFRPTLDSLMLVRILRDYITLHDIKINTLLDFGAGSGIIGIALAKMLGISRLILIDNNPFARNLCQRNSHQISCATDVVVLKAMTTEELEKVDVAFAVSNPPYFQNVDSSHLKREWDKGVNGNAIIPDWISANLKANIPFAFVLAQEKVHLDWLLNSSPLGHMISLGSATVIDRYSESAIRKANPADQTHVIEFLLCSNSHHSYENDI